MKGGEAVGCPNEFLSKLWMIWGMACVINNHQFSAWPYVVEFPGVCDGSLEVKTTIKVGKGGESHNGHGGWHLIACYQSDEAGGVRFLHLMCASLNDHRSQAPDWKYVGSRVNAATGSQRTETYVTTPAGTTKLRDGSVYIDPSIDVRRWRQERGGQPIPTWSIYYRPGGSRGDPS